MEKLKIVVFLAKHLSKYLSYTYVNSDVPDTFTYELCLVLLNALLETFSCVYPKHDLWFIMKIRMTFYSELKQRTCCILFITDLVPLFFDSLEM